MNIEAAFPSTFLKAADLGGRKVPVTIDRVEIDKVGDDNKPILYFQGKDKGLALNVTNKNAIVDLYGPETDDWAGQPIILYEAMVQYQSKMVPAIRVMGPPRTVPARPARTATAAAGDPRSDADMAADDVPF